MKTNMLERSKIIVTLILALIFTFGAQAQYTWAPVSGAAFSSGGCWGGVAPAATTVAQFSTNPTTSPTVTTNAGTAAAVYVLSSRTTSLSLSGTSLALSGATISSTSGVVLAHFGTDILNIACPISQGSAKAYLTAGSSSSLTPGSAISITGIISGSGGASFQGGGTWNGSTGVCGGVLRLGAANTFTGTLAVGSVSSGILELGIVTGVASASVNINAYSQLYFPVGGTFSTVPLTINGIGNNAATPYGRGAIRVGAVLPIWGGAVTLASNSVISVANGGTLTLSGAVSGPGQLIKEGTGSLVLSGTTNLSFAGGILLSEGSISITRNGSITAPFPISLFQINGNSVTLTLGNSTAQTISSLSSNFSNTSGTITQVLAMGTNCSLTINQSGNTTFGYGATTSLSSIITGTGTSSIIKTGAGSLTFNGWPHTFTGGITISGGSIILAPSTTITTANAISLSGGTLATTGIGASAICSLGVLNNVAASTIALDATQVHTLRFTSLNTNTGTITITGWQGAFDGTSGTKGKIFVGTSATLTGTQLNQFQFQDGSGNIIPATQITGGELVPKISINIVASSYGPFYNNIDNTISVSYTTSTTFFTGNFRVQLSNSTGIFTNTTSNIIGTGAWSSSGTIVATISSGTTVGPGYRVRILSTTPYVIASADNNSNISIALPVPIITSLSAYKSVVPGNTITINGNNFNSTPSNNVVYFGAVKGNVVNGSTTTLSVTVPFGATYSQLTAYDTITKFSGSSNIQFLPAFDASYFVADTIKFQPRYDYATGNNPVIAAIGDLDGDGLPDMVALNKSSATIKILQNQGSGAYGFTIGSPVTLQGSGPLNVKIADIDGDGRNDIIVSGGSGSATVQIFRNTTNFQAASTPRTLSFAARIDISLSGYTISAGVLSIADFDGDGKSDIAVACYDYTASTGKLIILKNGNSPGAVNTFTISSYNAGTVYHATSSAIAIGDFNGDMLPDIAVTNMIEAPVAASISVFKNTSTPNAVSFATAVNVPTGQYLVDIVATDVDGDNKQDLIVSEALDNTISLYRNITASTTSTLSFAGQQLISTSSVSNTPAGLAIGDLDADGKPDLAAVNFVTTGSVSIFKNTSTAGSPSFYNTTNLPAARYPTGINIGDIDKDGYPDLIVGNTSFDTTYTGTTVSVFRNTPLPKIGTISSAADSICPGSVTTLSYSLTLPTGETGAWSSSNTSVATVSNTGVVYSISAGTTDISYTVTVTRGNISRSVIRTIVVKPLPTVNISGYRGVCQGVTTTLSGSPTGGNWSNSNAITTVSASGAVTGVGSSGTDIISYTYTSPITGCTNADTQAMPILFSPNVGTIAGADSVCPGGVITLSTSGDIGGKWYSNNILFASVDSLSGVVTGQNSGTPTINYRITNGCGVFNTYKLIQVQQLPDPGVISGASTVCAGSGISLSNSVSGGVWSSSNTSLATVNSSGYVTAINSGAPIITFTASNYCGSSTTTKSITINTVPATPSAISGTSTICKGSTTTLSSATTGGSWTSSDITLATVTPTTGIVSGIIAGTPVISYTTSNTCGASAPAMVTVTVLNLPDANISSAIVPCDGYSSNIVFSGTPNDIISYNVDGGANIDGTLIGGSYTLSTGIITSSHTYALHTVRNVACAILKDTSIILIPQQMTWLGGAAGAETSWTNVSNWSCGSVPLVTDNVIIPNVTYVPAISSTVYSKDLTIAPLAKITMNTGGEINIKGNISNNGAITGSGRVKLSGSANQKISGKGSIDNLELNNSSGATIDSAAHLIINKALFISSGTLNTNDSLELASTDSQSTARIATLPASGAMISGKVKVDQYVVGGYRRFRFVSHPFADTISLSQLQTYIDITGVGGAANGFRTTASNAPSAFRLDPMTSNSSIGYDPGWKAFTKINSSAADTNTFHPGQGLRIFFRGIKGEGLGYGGSTGGYAPSPATFKMIGHVNQGPVTLHLRKGITDPVNQEFNMVGNPYPSPVDIGTVIYNAKVANQVTGSAFYVWDPTMSAGGQYVSISIGTASATPYYVQANTAFQVRAHHDGAVLNFDETNKVAVTSSFLFKGTSEFVSLNVYDANYHLWDILQFNFNDNASDKEDEQYDARKLMNGDFAFYSNSADGRELSIDTRPFDDSKVIPLTINSSYMQNFIIRADNINVPAGKSLFLHDKYLGTYSEMKQGSEYTFSISKEKTTQGNRFELALRHPDVHASTAISMQLLPNPAKEDVMVNFASQNTTDATLTIMDMNGMTVFEKQYEKVQNGSFSISLRSMASGMYLVEMTKGNEKITQKLVKE